MQLIVSRVHFKFSDLLECNMMTNERRRCGGDGRVRVKVRIRFRRLAFEQHYRDIPMRITPCCAKISATATEKLIFCVMQQKERSHYVTHTLLGYVCFI